MSTKPKAHVTNAVILVTTHSKVARYLPLVRSAIDAFWIGHPPVRFVTDGGAEPMPDVYVGSVSNFVPLFAQGLTRIHAEFPNATHIFHMLEDHCPLRMCDAGRISAIASMAHAHDLAAVSFPTYKWPWHETEATEYPDGLVRTWRRVCTREMAGEIMGIVPRDFFRYFQVQPTLWRLSYLEHACAAAIAADVLDPWQFEAVRLPAAEQHYVSRYNWPTVHHGFLVQGTINPLAIDFVDRVGGNAIRRQLIRELVGDGSETLFKVQRAASRYVQGLRRRIKAR